MIRTFFFLLKLALLGGVIFWFSLNPGTLTIEWLGHFYKIHIGLGILAVLIASILGMILLYIFLTLKKLPQIWRNFQNKSREKKDIKASPKDLPHLPWKILKQREKKY